MRCYAPIIVRGKESEGVKFWGFGKQVYQELLSFMADPDYGDISDPVTGRDITIEFKSKEQTGKDFPETSIRVKPNQTPVTQDKGVIEKLGQQPKVTEIFKEYSYDEIENLLKAWLDPESAPEAPAAPAKATNANKSNLEASAAVATVDDVASAFDNLFNQ
jgi:hypothetical protein